jgi:hypothetical protein
VREEQRRVTGTAFNTGAVQRVTRLLPRPTLPLVDSSFWLNRGETIYDLSHPAWRGRERNSDAIASLTQMVMDSLG